ncbi:MAG TPA: hypothetical protein PL045_01410 [Chitinophagaceae bacterium]|nr:hypothetical protein [Chitinophagaceae bacterium]
MKNFLGKYYLYIAGAAIGAIAGFFYWKYIGCTSGQCLISSKPVNSTVYFGIMGALMLGMFKRNPKQSEEESKD